MKEDKLINQLKYLNKLEPSSKTLKSLEKQVLSVVDQDKNVLNNRYGFLIKTKQLYNSHPNYFFSSIFTLILIVVVIKVFYIPISNQTQIAAANVQIALASNAYQKSQISFNLAKYQLNSFQNNPNFTNEQTATLAYATGQTNDNLASLKLVGESGKYSAEQCQSIYKEYENYLDNLKSIVEGRMDKTKNQSTKSKMQSLLNQITNYEKQSDSRLNMYKKF